MKALVLHEIGGPEKLHLEAIDKLVTRHRKGGVINLMCWCAPRACHGEVIKAFILEKSK